MTRVLLTGATGYLGGEALHTLVNSSLNSTRIRCLIRDETKAEQVQSAYPNVDVVLGDLDDTTLVKREAEAADIVLHLASTSHVVSTKAIAEGLQDRAQRTQTPAYWIQISGATCFATDEIASGRFGFASDAVYDDMKDQADILSTFRNNPKRVVENTVLAQTPSTVRTALIVGPLIYGVGRGPLHQRSIQAPEIAKATISLGHGFKLNEGQNIWSNIHVQDIAGLACSLASAGAQGKDGLWNDEGVYNVENGGEMTFEHLSSLITNEAYKQGIIKEDATSMEVIDAEKADLLSGHASILWGTNARTRANKARQTLGWSPLGLSLADTIPDLVRREAEGLGLKL